jgi:hypothetical protein
MTPGWILDIFAAVMLAVAAVSAARLVAARPWQRGAAVTDTDISHLLMGIAMSGVLASSLATLPNDAWIVVFAVLTAWFGYRVVRDYRASGARALTAGHCAPHLAHSAAMVYMFAALKAPAPVGMSGMGAMSGMSMLGLPTLAFLFAIILAAYTIWDLDQLSGLRLSVAAAAAPALAGVSADAAATETTAALAAPAAGSVAALNSPGIVVGCRIAMGVTMALMLFLMI